MRDGSNVRLTSDQWNRLGGSCREAIALSARGLRWAVLMTVPFSLMLMVLIANIPGASAAVDALDRRVPGIAVLLIIWFLPVAATTWHMLVVQRAVEETFATLAWQPRCAAPQTGRRGPINALEIAALVLIGPHLLIQIYGTLDPDAFRNTPWTGSRLTASGIAGLAVLVALAGLRWLDRRRSGAVMPSEMRVAADAPAHPQSPPAGSARGFGRKRSA